MIFWSGSFLYGEKKGKGDEGKNEKGGKSGRYKEMGLMGNNGVTVVAYKG